MSTPFVARRLYYGEEASYGEAAEVREVFGIARKFSAGGELVREDVRMGDRTYHERVLIGINFTPSIEFHPLTGKFLKYVLGKVTDSGTSPPYTHVIEVGTSLKSLTVEAARMGGAGVAERLVGLLVDSCEISVESDGLLSVSLECRAKKASLVSPYADPNIHPPAKRPIKFTDMSFYVDGTQYAVVTSARITVTNNLEERPRAGDGTVSGFVLKGAEYGAEVELLFDDASLYDRFLSGRASDVELRFSRGPDDHIRFLLEDSYLEVESELPFDGDVLTQTLRIHPRKIRVEVRDDMESY